MLKKLEISNYAIIDKIEIGFSDRLTIITGETGAGKSILMGALGLILGKRADTKVLFDDQRKCYIEGTFSIDGLNLQHWFEDHEMEYEEELVIRREISKSGKSRAFLNDGLVTLQILRELSIHLIDIFAQFDNLDLQEHEEQFNVLDTLANQKKLVTEYQAKYKQWAEAKSALGALESELSQKLKEQDYIKFQFEEIEQLNLQVGELAKLEDKHAKMSQSEDIKLSCSTAIRLLKDGEHNVIRQLAEVLNGFRSIKTEISEVEDFKSRLDSSLVELEDLTIEIESYNDSDVGDLGNLANIESRLSEIYQLFRKHQLQNEEGLLSLQSSLQNQLSSSSQLEQAIELTKKTIKDLSSTLISQGEKIHQGRKKVKPKLEKEVAKLLDQLAMPDGKILVNLKKTETLKSNGLDDVDFLFTANVGKAPQPINKVASGGELSRLNLCLKSIVAGKTTLPTLIFDEIDTGISGMVAEKMGSMIHELAARHQIISITHSPQIAAKADQHYFVYKQGHTGKTITQIKSLNKEERITEIATMLSTNPPSKSALANAKELLKLK